MQGSSLKKLKSLPQGKSLLKCGMYTFLSLRIATSPQEIMIKQNLLIKPTLPAYSKVPFSSMKPYPYTGRDHQGSPKKVKKSLS